MPTLGELLVREKLISLQQLKQARTDQAKSGRDLSYTLAKLGYISDGEITDFLSSQYRLPAINLEEYDIEVDIIELVAKEVCELHRVIPVARSGSSLIVAMADPTNLHAIDDIKFLTGYDVVPVVASETAVHAAIERYYSAGPSFEEVTTDFDLADDDIEFSPGEDAVNELEQADRALAQGYVRAGERHRGVGSASSTTQNDIERSDAVRAGERFRDRAWASDEMWSSEVAARELNLSREALNKRRQSRRVLGLQASKRGVRYPRWQFEDAVQPYIADVLAALPHLDAWGHYLFFTRPEPLLAGSTPLDALRRRLSENVLHVARLLAKEATAG